MAKCQRRGCTGSISFIGYDIVTDVSLYKCDACGNVERARTASYTSGAGLEGAADRPGDVDAPQSAYGKQPERRNTMHALTGIMAVHNFGIIEKCS